MSFSKVCGECFLYISIVSFFRFEFLSGLLKCDGYTKKVFSRNNFWTKYIFSFISLWMNALMQSFIYNSSLCLNESSFEMRKNVTKENARLFLTQDGWCFKCSHHRSDTKSLSSSFSIFIEELEVLQSESDAIITLSYYSTTERNKAAVSFVFTNAGVFSQRWGPAHIIFVRQPLMMSLSLICRGTSSQNKRHVFDMMSTSPKYEWLGKQCTCKRTFIS